jgi:hypothetical protein
MDVNFTKQNGKICLLITGKVSTFLELFFEENGNKEETIKSRLQVLCFRRQSYKINFVPTKV